MSYHINRLELSTALPNARTNVDSVKAELQHIHNYINNSVISDDTFAGAWADALKEYLKQTHVMITEILMGAIEAFKKLLLEYPMALEPYDRSTSVIVDEEHLAEVEKWIQDLSRHMQGYHSNADAYLDNISDLKGFRNLQSIERYIGRLSYLEKKVTELREGVKESDYNYGRAGLSFIRELMDDARGIINNIQSNGEITAEKCSFAGYYDAEKSNAIYKHMIEASLYLNDTTYTEGIEEYYGAVQEQIENIIECAARDRFWVGLIKYTIVGTEIVIAAASMGTAGGVLLATNTTTWGVIGAEATMLSAGATIYYKSGELGEAWENMYYGSIGDITTPAQNFILVGAYDGDEEAMDLDKALITGVCSLFQFYNGLDDAISAGDVAKVSVDTIKAQYSLKQIGEVVIDETMDFGVSTLQEVLDPYIEDSLFIDTAVDQSVDIVADGIKDGLKDGFGNVIDGLTDH